MTSTRHICYCIIFLSTLTTCLLYGAIAEERHYPRKFLWFIQKFKKCTIVAYLSCTCIKSFRLYTHQYKEGTVVMPLIKVSNQQVSLRDIHINTNEFVGFLWIKKFEYKRRVLLSKINEMIKWNSQVGKSPIPYGEMIFWENIDIL